MCLTTPGMKSLCPLLIFFAACIGSFAQSVREGERNFQAFCAACHSIGKGKLVGPDLIDVHKRRTDDWLVEFVTSSQTMIRSGDKTAVTLFKEYNQSVMPDPPFSVDQIRSILLYIKSRSPGYAPESDVAQKEVATEPETPTRSVTEATEQEIRTGRMLFAGQVRLREGGPACISCHHVKNDKLIGGGLLAKDLTDAFSRMNETGIKAILTSPPFPAMREAYQNAPIADEEAYNLIAFLKQADEDQYGQHPRNYKQYFLVAGGISFLALLGIYSVIWSNRKRRSVNQRIYDRQVYS